jgi:hypothetical protein
MKKILVMFALLTGLSACSAGIGIEDYGQRSNNASIDTLGSASAQASIGIIPAADD